MHLGRVAVKIALLERGTGAATKNSVNWYGYFHGYA